jgi:hypothetical protein
MIAEWSTLLLSGENSPLTYDSSPPIFISILPGKMNYLHAAIIEDFEECLIAANEDDLREQVNTFLIGNSITPPTDEEWAVCVLTKSEDTIPIEHLTAVGLISYYKVDARMERAKLMEKLKAMR